jgi:glutamate-1-semialdehyde 2,1-aminomutase
MVSVSPDSQRAVPIDFMTAPQEQRSFLGEDPGYHEALRRLTRETGTLLLIDETHTLSSGPGGYTALHGLEPDMFVVGKAIAGGIPAAAFGLSQATAEQVWQVLPKVPPTVRQSAHAGFGGTLAGKPRE